MKAILRYIANRASRSSATSQPAKNESIAANAAGPTASELVWSELVTSVASPNELYDYLENYYHHRAPSFLREHREFFKSEQRGFGEDAFHAMWWLLFLEQRPLACLEIGVYRGQVISLWTLISKVIHASTEVWGVSPLLPVNDSVSRYRSDLDYAEDIRTSFAHLKLGTPNLVQALSTDENAIEFIKSKEWDLIYIDGSHEEDVVLQDYRFAKESLRSGGILVLDDAALEFGCVSGPGRFAGHPGPSAVAHQYAAKEMKLLGVVGHNVLFRKW